MGERQSVKAERFGALHEGKPFLIPNPWDAGSARVLEALGFEGWRAAAAPSPSRWVLAGSARVREWLGG